MADRNLSPIIEHVVADVVEGEAVIINVATSIYYGTRGVGGWVWERFSAGASLAQTAAEAAARFEVNAETAAADIEAFASQLLAEGLVRESPAASAAADVPPTARTAYAKPELDVYRDMKDLLALDPPMPSMDLPQDGSPRAA